MNQCKKIMELEGRCGLDKKWERELIMLLRKVAL